MQIYTFTVLYFVIHTLFVIDTILTILLVQFCLSEYYFWNVYTTVYRAYTFVITETMAALFYTSNGASHEKHLSRYKISNIILLSYVFHIDTSRIKQVWYLGMLLRLLLWLCSIIWHLLQVGETGKRASKKDQRARVEVRRLLKTVAAHQMDIGRALWWNGW